MFDQFLCNLVRYSVSTTVIGQFWSKWMINYTVFHEFTENFTQIYYLIKWNVRYVYKWFILTRNGGVHQYNYCSFVKIVTIGMENLRLQNSKWYSNVLFLTFNQQINRYNQIKYTIQWLKVKQAMIKTKQMTMFNVLSIQVSKV